MAWIAGLFGAMKGAISVVAALIDLLKWWQKYQAEQEEKAAAERAAKRQEAIDALKKAETDEEMFDAQTGVVNNRPR